MLQRSIKLNTRINVVVFRARQGLYLLRFESGKAEHANLVSHVLPVVSGALLLQISHQHFSHSNDTVCHSLHLLQPTHNIFSIYKHVTKQMAKSSIQVCTSHHVERSSGVVRIVEAMRAPFMGGLE